MNKTFRTVREGAFREAPTILTIFGVSGVFTTTILSIKGTIEALEILNDEEKYYLEFKDKVKLTWKCYIPTGISAILTSACCLASNRIHLKRNAVAAGLYTVAIESLREYQAKVIETVGKKKEDKIREDISEDRIRKNPPKDQMIFFGNGDVLFYDVFSGRYFESTMEKVKRAINDFNYELFDDMYKSINEFYDLIGLEDIEAGHVLGWHIERGKLEPRFDAKLVNAPDSRWHDQPCIVLSYIPDPRWSI